MYTLPWKYVHMKLVYVMYNMYMYTHIIHIQYCMEYGHAELAYVYKLYIYT